MKAVAILALALLTQWLPACAMTQEDKSAREWQRNECNRVVDRDDREKCLKRVE